MTQKNPFKLGSFSFTLGQQSIPSPFLPLSLHNPYFSLALEQEDSGVYIANLGDHAEEGEIDQTKFAILFQHDGFRYIIIVVLFLRLSNFVCLLCQVSFSLSFSFFIFLFFSFLHSEIMFVAPEKINQSRVDNTIFHNTCYYCLWEYFVNETTMCLT